MASEWGGGGDSGGDSRLIVGLVVIGVALLILGSVVGATL